MSHDILLPHHASTKALTFLHSLTTFFSFKVGPKKPFNVSSITLALLMLLSQLLPQLVLLLVLLLLVLRLSILQYFDEQDGEEVAIGGEDGRVQVHAFRAPARRFLFAFFAIHHSNGRFSRHN